MVAVHQFLATFAPRDAVGAHARHARRILRSMGIRSEIYADGVRGASGTEVRPYASFEPADHGRPTWLLYQLSTGSPVADFLAARPEPLVLNHHNVTPPALVAPWEPHLAAELERGRRQVRRLAPAARLGVAVSAFNEASLVQAGCPRTTVAPVLVDLDPGRTPPDRRRQSSLRRAKRGGGCDWLFVGRVAPHKCQHDVVGAFAAYRRAYDPRARLWLVGAVGSPSYATAVERAVADLGLAGAVRFTGSVSAGRLEAHYREADIFVGLSEHEGFCIPLVEAMARGVPVVTYATAAVPETVGEAAVLLPRRDPATVAAAVARVRGDAALRTALVAAGRHRADRFGLERGGARFREVIEELVHQ